MALHDFFQTLMEIQQLKEISTRMYSSVQPLMEADVEVLKKILELSDIKYGRIRTFSEEDSKIIIMLALKQNCIILMKFLLESKIELPRVLLDSTISLLIKECSIQGGCADPQAVLEKERITRQLTDCIIDLLYLSEYTNEELKQYLISKTLPDDVSINLVPLVDCEYKSFEMMVLHKLVIGPVLLSVICAHKDRLRKVVKTRIINKIKNMFESGDNSIQYQIFYLINEEEHLDVLKNQPAEHTSEYIGFVSSLIRSRDSAIIAYGKLSPFLEEFEMAITILLNYSGSEEKRIQPRDEELIYLILEAIVRLLEHKSVSFYKFVQPAQRLLMLSLGPKLKGLLYDFLSFFASDMDVYIERVIECKQELEEEQSTGVYFMLPKLIKFLNEYRKREEAEKGPGNEKFQVQDPEGWHKELECRIAGLRSEDPETLVECLEVQIPIGLLQLNSGHIRAAMLKNESVIARVVEYQLQYKTVIDDVSIVNIISSSSSKDFFAYASLFPDFSFYLNENVLEQISDNLEAGVEWMLRCYSREIGEFVRRHSAYFNGLLLRNKWIQPKLTEIYKNILTDHLKYSALRASRGQPSELSISLLDSTSTKLDLPTNPDTFILFDDKDILSDALFRIFAMQLLHSKLVLQADITKYLLKRKYNHPGYVLYVKAKYMAGEDVTADVDFLRKNLVDVDDLVGYLVIAGQDGLKPEESRSVLGNFGETDSDMFVSRFAAASELERFVMLFGLKNLTKSAETLIKDEIMANLRTKNRVYLKMLVMQLFKCSDKDSILRVLEKSYEDKEMLLKLNIHNIATGGRYCSKALIAQGKTELVRQALFLAFYLKIWDKAYVAELAAHIDNDGSEEWKSLLSDIKDGRN